MAFHARLQIWEIKKLQETRIVLPISFQLHSCTAFQLPGINAGGGGTGQEDSETLGTARDTGYIKSDKREETHQ